MGERTSYVTQAAAHLGLGKLFPSLQVCALTWEITIRLRGANTR
jgi:hypothetical protein